MLKCHVPDKLEFTFYKDEEIVKMSVMEVTQPLSLDAFNNPYPNGLYDPRMGSHNNDTICKTCNLSFLGCPGHFGYIKLAKPVFNPLIFTTTYLLLKATCYKCGLLKLTKYERIIVYLKLNLLKRGCSIDNLDYLYGVNSEAKLYQKVADILLENSKVEMISSNFNHQEFVDLILKTAAARNKCFVCRTKGCKLICNKNLKISIVEDNNGKVVYSTFYPEKIMEIFKNLFSNERDLMEGMFSTNNFKMFFILNIAVPPVKFRPMNYLNGRSYENPQNIHYIRILNCNTELNNGKDFWPELQAAILGYYDSSKSSYNKGEHVAGHKQILEKKEGLFRRNIMGKRVNFAARSVISPDPNLKTREMGIPKIFAEKLTFPEKVNLNNYNQLRKAVINGKNYPGANSIQNGKILQSLEFLSHEKRVALANQLLNGNKIVWRHLKDGDNVLVNRQPTLHMPSIMGHKVKVLKGEKTLRMHYVNCKPYNADFDGDEMNVHFPQSDVAQAEIEYLSLNDNMYLVPTNGEPIRGLTQDHIVAASVLTLKNSFFTKEHYIDLLVAGLPNRKLKLERPCISSPIELYSGKQIITSLLKNLNLKINLSIKGKVDASTWKDHVEEKTVEIRNGQMLTGILDKNVLGPTKFSLIHACGELYGYALTNDLLSYFSNIVNRYLFLFGFTMRVDDLLLNLSADISRQQIIEEGKVEAAKIQKQYIESNPDYYLNSAKTAQLDALVREKMNFVTTEIVKASVPEGQLKRFPENNMGLIIITGAKGSMVNLSQISGSLGQQELEGKRVMHMVSGKTLPSFNYFECSPSAGGYVFQRFLTGVNPQEYFFHCMAGREGLIDTAVKTSRSGYLQRCLIKHLEGIKVEYDLSVRMGNKIIQYTYGEDGLDYTKSSFIHKTQFFKDNIPSIECSENLINYFDQFRHMSSINLIYENNLINEDEKIKNMCNYKYIKSLVDPGEAVGVVAGQSLGEPSTQMTLNTFHLAGVGAKNVTLGIPRLREIVMVASKKIQTPMIIVPLKKEVPSNVVESYQKLTLDECIEDLEVKEKLISKQGVFMKEIIITVTILRNEKIAVPYLDSKFLFLLGRQIKKLTKSTGSFNILEIEIKEDTEKEIEEDSDKDESSTEEEKDDQILKINKNTENDLENEEIKNEDDILNLVNVDNKIENNKNETNDVENDLENSEESNKDVFIKTQNFKNIGNKKYTFSAYYPSDFNIMLIPLIESILPKIVIREIRNITKATISENNMIFEGSDFRSLTDLVKIEDGNIIDPLEYFDIYKSSSNDIYSITNFLGIEAARESIINEIISVFDAYGIEIDIRHLMLIADYMTRNGEYVPFNRMGLNLCNSPLQKMSFESCFTNIKKASEFHVSDDLSNPSASLTVGTPVKIGTNTFEILYNMDSQTV